MGALRAPGIQTLLPREGLSHLAWNCPPGGRCSRSFGSAWSPQIRGWVGQSLPGLWVFPPPGVLGALGGGGGGPGPGGGTTPTPAESQRPGQGQRSQGCAAVCGPTGCLNASSAIDSVP